MFRNGGTSKALDVGSRRKILTSFADGSELLEEYDVKTGELLLRKKRQKGALGKDSGWAVLSGEEVGSAGWNPQLGVLKESTLNPFLVRKDTKTAFQWRIRNLPYSADVYNVSLDNETKELVVRTSNKKYYKRVGIPELDILQQPLEEAKLSFTHAHNTLIISYEKSAQILALEATDRQEAQKMLAESDPSSDCKQQ